MAESPAAHSRFSWKSLVVFLGSEIVLAGIIHATNVFPPVYIVVVGATILLVYVLFENRRSMLEEIASGGAVFAGRTEPTIGSEHKAIGNELQSTDDVGKLSQPKRDEAKANYISELYPILHAFSEVNVDEFGDAVTNWRQQFLSGNSSEWIKSTREGLKQLCAYFEDVRRNFIEYRLYEEIFEMDNSIAIRINEIGSSIDEIDNIAGIVSYQFNSKTIVLVEGPMKEFQLTIGRLRTHVSQECLARLATIRKAAVG